MPTLHKYLHVIVFAILLILISMLNFGPFAVGWPFPFADNRGAPWIFKAIVHLVINAVPCMMILSLCMVPFAYDSKRSFSAGSILTFTTAASLGFLILTPQYLANYQIGDHLLIIVMTALAMNGVITWTLQTLGKFVELPQWRRSNKTKGNELDFD